MGMTPPGWYTTDAGYRWWDGTTWGALAPPQPVDEIATGKTTSVLCHLGFLFGGFILPLIVYLIEGKNNAYVRHHSREALNFQITFTLVWMVMFIPMWLFMFIDLASRQTPRTGAPIGGFVFIGVALLAFAAMIGFSAMGAVRASQGVEWRYPVNVRFVRDRRSITP